MTEKKIEERDVQRVASDAAVAAASVNGESPEVVTTSQGIKFKVQVVPPLFLRQATQGIPEPQPPSVYIEEKGRSEENPSDPAYQAAHLSWEQAVNMASMNVMLLVGTKLDSVPEGVPGPNDDEWLDILDALDIQIKKDSPAARYLAWVQYVLADVDDLAMVIDAIGKRTGVKEEDVATTVRSFRGGEARGADNEPAEEAVGGHGDQVQPDSNGARTGNRRARRRKK